MKDVVVIERDVRVRMSDGVELLADIYRMAKNGRPVVGRFPVILVRTSYNKADMPNQALDPEFFAKGGNVVVVQDVRGRYKSEGIFYPGSCEVEDGYDTIEWIAQQPWSNGRIGMTGISYVASVQHAAAISGTTYLTSIFYVKGCADYYQYCYRRGGAFMMYRIPLSFSLAMKSKEALNDPALSVCFAKAFENAPEWVSRPPFEKGDSPLHKLPDYEQYLLDQMHKTDFDSFWKENPFWQPKQHLDRHADIAGYYVSGWYDKYRADILYTALSTKSKCRPIKLLIGPYTHWDFESFAGDVDFGSQTAIGYDQFMALQLDWFEQTLKGKHTGILDEPPVKIFVMGGGNGRMNRAGRMNHGGAWRFENEWPLARTQFTKYFLHSDGVLGVGRDTTVEAPSRFIYDPENPVPTIGGTSYFVRGSGMDNDLPTTLFIPYGAYDQRENPEFYGCDTNMPLSARQDVLVFQTQALTDDEEVTGPVTVRLWCSSSAVDTDFTAKLIDVCPPNEDYPDGYAMNLTDSIIRARYRCGFANSELMKRGEIYRFTIELPPISNLFKKGHRIRLDISSSNYPTYDRNPNNGQPYLSRGKWVVAENFIYHNVMYPSHVVLPIIPTRP